MARQIGIMQGRLSSPPEGKFQCFPRQEWEAEFSRAAKAGLSCIEWIYDSWGAEMNPISNDSGLVQMRILGETHGVKVSSMCADWFMEQPLLRAARHEIEAGVARLRWLIRRASAAGIERVVLPFVDASKIEEEKELRAVAETLTPLAEELYDANVEIHLETALGPQEFAALLTLLPAEVFKVNYDSGNSASLGYAPSEEFAAYGARVGNIHIKDRRRGGGSVPLGTGDADFGSLFAEIGRVKYSRDFILQVARGEPGDEVRWAIANRAFVEARLPDLR